MERLTHKRVNGIKTGYWSASKKEELVQRLVEYENTGLTPEQVQQLKKLNTPIRPDFEGDGYTDGELVYDTWICPNCETSYKVDYDRYFYCPNCGQKIKWSE